MIDLHCHILPGVDDGAGDLETALAMAKLAWDRGTRALAVTPHCGLPGGSGNFWGPEMEERFRALREALREAEIPLRVLPGMEFFGGEDLGALYDRGRLMPLAGGRYLLTEFYFDESTAYMTSVLEEALDRGLIPLVAHPERYEAVQRRPETVREWIGRGCGIQVNKGSVLGDLGPRVEETAWELLRRGLVHAVASDAHGSRRRTPDLSRVRRHLERALGSGYSELLLEGNPARVLTDRPLRAPGRGNLETNRKDGWE